MANTLTNLMDKILARGLMVLRQWAMMPRLVNLDYAQEARMKGSTIDIPIAADMTEYDISPSNVEKDPADTSNSLVQINLNKWKGAAFFLTDDDQMKIDRNRHFLPMQTLAAIKCLANRINQDVYANYTGIYGFVGTAGTTPFGSTVQDATNLRKILNKQICPLEDRRAVLDFDADANALSLAAFADTSQSDDSDVKIRGKLGVKYGFDWFADHHVPLHTAGTLSNGSTHSALINGTVAVGATTMNIDSTTLTGTIVTGEIFTVAGDTQTYVVTNSSTLTAAANAITGVTFLPASVLGFADNAAVTFKDTHRVNLGFHRDAFALAIRPVLDSLAGIENLGSKISTMTDELTGITLRLEVKRQNKRVIWEFDVLYGSALVRRELACRLAG